MLHLALNLFFKISKIYKKLLRCVSHPSAHRRHLMPRKPDINSLMVHFTLPLAVAANNIGIGTSTAKRLCRKHGIFKWPHRRMASLKRLVSVLPDVSHEKILAKEIFDTICEKHARSYVDMLMYIDDVWPRVEAIEINNLSNTSAQHLNESMRETHTTSEASINIEIENWWMNPYKEKFEAASFLDEIRVHPISHTSLETHLAIERERLRILLG